MRCPTITNSFLQQEYPTYTILGQSQYQTCYPSSGFGVVPPADSNTESMALATTTYPAEKPNALVPARVVQRPSSGEAGSVKDDCKIPLLNSAGGRCGETSPKGTYGIFSCWARWDACLPCQTGLTGVQSITVGQPYLCTRSLLLLQFQDTCHVLCVPQGKGMRGVIGRVASSSSLGCSHGLTGQLLVFSLNSSCCTFLSCSQVFRVPGSHDIASPSYGSPPRVLLHFQELWFSRPLSLSCL